MTLVRVSGPIHRDYRFWISPGSSGRVLTPFPDIEDEDAAGDQDDATYIQWDWTRNILVGGGTTLYLSMGTPATPVPELAASITGVTMYVRASYTSTRSEANQAGSGLEFGLSHDILSGEFDVEEFWDLYSETPSPLIADGVVREYSKTWLFEDFAVAGNDPYVDWEPLRTGVAAGQIFANFWFHSSTVANQTARTDTIRLHEAWFEITSPVPEPEITGEAVTVRRRFVRSSAWQ